MFMYKTHKEHKKRPFMNKTQILPFALATTSAIAMRARRTARERVKSESREVRGAHAPSPIEQH